MKNNIVTDIRTTAHLSFKSVVAFLIRTITCSELKIIIITMSTPYYSLSSFWVSSISLVLFSLGRGVTICGKSV